MAGDDEDIVFVENTGVEITTNLFGESTTLDIAQDDLDAAELEYDDEELQAKEIAEETKRRTAFGETWVFDYIKGDFTQHGSEASKIKDKASFMEWATLAIRTQKGIYDIFDEDFGVELEPIWNGTIKGDGITAHLNSEIMSALSQHDRFLGMHDFMVKQREGSDIILDVTFTAETTAGEIEVTAEIGG